MAKTSKTLPKAEDGETGFGPGERICEADDCNNVLTQNREIDCVCWGSRPPADIDHTEDYNLLGAKCNCCLSCRQRCMNNREADDVANGRVPFSSNQE